MKSLFLITFISLLSIISVAAPSSSGKSNDQLQAEIAHDNPPGPAEFPAGTKPVVSAEPCKACGAGGTPSLDIAGDGVTLVNKIAASGPETAVGHPAAAGQAEKPLKSK